MGKNKGEMKYHTLKESLKNDILSGVYQPGDKMPSENQLVQEYDLSRHTVRKALSIWKKKVILLQFMERERFVQNGHFIKGIKEHCSVTTYISDYIFPRLIQGINSVLSKDGYSIIFKTTENSRRGETACLEDILTKDS